MERELQPVIGEQVTKSEILGLATWERQRSTEELMGFIAGRLAKLQEMPNFDEL